MKIAFTGPESCGKSTMASWCAEHFKLPLCEEFAREYLMDNPEYTQSDLDAIAMGQLDIWKKTGEHFIADTEMTVMKIWSEFRYKACSDTIQTAFTKQQFDHYFLCAPDIPWEPDPLREHPEERESLFLLYQAELIQSNRPFTILSGTMEARQKVVEDVLNRLLIA